MIKVASLVENLEVLINSGADVNSIRRVILGLAVGGRLGRNVSFPDAEDLFSANYPHLPNDWDICALGEIASYGRGSQISANVLSPDAWILDLEDIEKSTSRLLRRATVQDRPATSNKAPFMPGDVLYGKLRPYLDKVLVADAYGYSTTEIVAIVPGARIKAEWLRLCLKSPQFLHYVNSKMYGMKMPRLGTKDAVVSIHPVPPIDQQEQIVAKVDALMEMCDDLGECLEAKKMARTQSRTSAVAALRESRDPGQIGASWHRIESEFHSLVDAPDDVDDLLSAFLNLAIRGHLSQMQASDEKADDLIDRMKIEQQDALQRKVTRHALGKDPYGAHLEIPRHWGMLPLQDVAQFIDYRGKTPQKTTLGVPLITAKNVRQGYVSDDPAEYVSEATYEAWMTRGFPAKGDVLFTTEAPMGNAALVRSEDRFALAQRTILLSPYADFSGEFLEMVLRSPWFQLGLLRRATGMTATGIKAAKLRLMEVPVPPAPEQERIVNVVNGLVARCRELDALLQGRSKAASDFSDGLMKGL